MVCHNVLMGLLPLTVGPKTDGHKGTRHKNTESAPLFQRASVLLGLVPILTFHVPVFQKDFIYSPNCICNYQLQFPVTEDLLLIRMYNRFLCTGLQELKSSQRAQHSLCLPTNRQNFWKAESMVKDPPSKKALLCFQAPYAGLHLTQERQVSTYWGWAPGYSKGLYPLLWFSNQ